MLTVAESADILGVHSNTVLNYMDKLHGVKDGRRYWLDPKRVHDFAIMLEPCKVNGRLSPCNSAEKCHTCGVSLDTVMGRGQHCSFCLFDM